MTMTNSRFQLIKLDQDSYNWIFLYKDLVDGEEFRFEITQITHDPMAIIDRLLVEKSMIKRNRVLTGVLDSDF